MINGEIHLQRIQALILVNLPDTRQNLFLPGTAHDEIIDQQLKFILTDTFLEDIFIVFHDGIDVELHVQPLKGLVLFVPDGTCVIF